MPEVNRHPSKEELAYGGLTPDGDLFSVTQKGVLAFDGHVVETGVVGCNSVLFLEEAILLGGRAELCLLTSSGDG